MDGILEPDDPELRVKVKRLEGAGALYRINHLTWWKEEMPSEQEYEEAVSYTHLDVYKRQTLPSSITIIRSAFMMVLTRWATITTVAAPVSFARAWRSAESVLRCV